MFGALFIHRQMLACFNSDGILAQLSDFLKIIKRIGEINSLSILLGILSGPAALCGFRFFNNLFIYSVMLMFCISRCGLCPLSGIGSSLSDVKDFEIDYLVFQLYFWHLLLEFRCLLRVEWFDFLFFVS